MYDRFWFCLFWFESRSGSNLIFTIPITTPCKFNRPETRYSIEFNVYGSNPVPDTNPGFNSRSLSRAGVVSNTLTGRQGFDQRHQYSLSSLVLLIICRYKGVQLLRPALQKPTPGSHRTGPALQYLSWFLPRFAALHSGRSSVCIASAQKPAHDAAGRPPPLGAPPAVPPPPLANYLPSACLPTRREPTHGLRYRRLTRSQGPLLRLQGAAHAQGHPTAPFPA